MQEGASTEISNNWKQHFQEMEGDTGLEHDIINKWSLVVMATEDDEFFRDLSPQPHYADYFRATSEGDGMSGALAEQVLTHSRPNAVRKYDAIVDEYNAALPGIIEHHDTQSLQRFYERVDQLVRGSREQTH